MAAEGLLLLGVGGPEDPADIGQVDRLVFRPFVVDHPTRGAFVLVFSSVPVLMAFTRAVNGAAPFSVPTECRRLDAAEMAALEGVTVLEDPQPEAFRKLAAEGTAGSRRLSVAS